MYVTYWLMYAFGSAPALAVSRLICPETYPRVFRRSASTESTRPAFAGASTEDCRTTADNAFDRGGARSGIDVNRFERSAASARKSYSSGSGASTYFQALSLIARSLL